MRLDHVAYACGPDGLKAAVRRLRSQLGVPITGGGVHPRSGTTNAIAPLVDGTYLEVVGVLQHPAADKAPFGRAVKERTAAGGGWLGWVVAVDDLSPIEARLGRSAVAGHRTRPDGQELYWRQIGVRDMIAKPQLPFFIEWVSAPDDHPSAVSIASLIEPAADGDRPVIGTPTPLQLVELEISGDPDELAAWLGDASVDPLQGVHISWVDGPPGILAAHFVGPKGRVRIT